MNFDKKRRARVQGGWAAPNTNKQNGSDGRSSTGRSSNDTGSTPNHTNGKHKEKSQFSNHSRSHSARSETDKSKVPPMPVWVGKNIDQQTVRQKFVYEEPTEVRD